MIRQARNERSTTPQTSRGVLEWDDTHMTTVRRESLAEQAAELLLHRIQDGEWRVGSKLPGETTLAPQLGVGRSTAREAIRILAGKGVLATRQGAGVFVLSVEALEPWPSVLGRADILAVLDARAAIETEAAVLAADRRTSDDLVDLKRTLRAREDPQPNISGHVEADMAFHRCIVRAAHSPLLLELFDGFASRSLQAMTNMLRLVDHPESGADQHSHAEIADAIAARDGERAGALTRAHLRTLAARLG